MTYIIIYLIFDNVSKSKIKSRKIYFENIEGTPRRLEAVS